MSILNQLTSLFSNNVSQTPYNQHSQNTASKLDNTVTNNTASSLTSHHYGDSVTISNTAKSILSSDQRDDNSVTMNTNKGYKKLDLDDYFLPPKGNEGVKGLNDVVFLMPSQDNVDAITEHLSKKMPQFLKDNNIPEPPSTIQYDNLGQIQLPHDYPYAAQFKQALEETPAMARELHTVNALASHVNEMKKLTPFNEELSQAKSLTEQNLIVKKYQHLLNDNRENDTILLNFDTDGKLSISAEKAS
jgi:hypothetical protein